jgi:hypothetical protein
MLRRVLLIASALMSGCIPFAASATASQDPAVDEENGWPDGEATAVGDDELAEMTGKFTLPNGTELAMSVTSDTVINGQLALRTVLTVDQGSRLEVFGRQGGAASEPYTMSGSVDQPITQATGVSVMLDRRSGIQTVTPTYGVSASPNVATTPGAANDAAAQGLTLLPIHSGGPAVATAHGHVSLSTTDRGSQVTLAGDQLGVAHIVGQYIATAIVNSANDRTIDTVTNVNIDLRDASPYMVGSAMLRIDGLAQSVAVGLAR